MSTRLLLGDCREVLRSLPAASVQACVTSPPYYGLRDYGLPALEWPDGWRGSHGLEPSPELYVQHEVEVFREVKRVLRDDGTLWLNLGSSYFGGGKGPTGQNGIGDQSARQGWPGSRHVPAYGNDGIAPAGSTDLDSVYPDLCDGCRDAIAGLNHRTADSTPRSHVYASLLSQISRDTARKDYDPASPLSSERASPESTSLQSSQQPRDGCSHCGNCGACLSVLRSVSRDAQACVRRMAGLSEKHLGLLAIQDLYARIRGSAEIDGALADRITDTVSDWLAQIDSTKANHPYKPKDEMLLPFRVALALQRDGWYVRSCIPWLKRNCLSGGTRVYVRSQKGDMPMSVKDLARLKPETCKLWNGERWTQLVSMWEVPRGEGDEIEIELRSGERIGCTPDHRWPTERGLLRAYELSVGDVLTGTILPKPTTAAAQQPGGSYGWLDDNIGWFVGLYLAEGSMSNGTIQIASHTNEVARYGRLQAIAAAYDGTCRAHLKRGQSMTINLTGPVLRGIVEQYIGGRTAKDKHLTNRCWRRSNEFLRSVLDGYLSGDGHWDEQNQRWRLGFTRNYAWEADLRTIAARLNIDLRVKLATGRYAAQDVPIFRGSIRFERSKRLWAKNEREIVRIGHSRGRKFWDIAVEDDPHTFALASGVLTHNSMPESVRDRPATSVEYVFLLSKSARYFYDADAVRVPQTGPPVEHFGKVVGKAGRRGDARGLEQIYGNGRMREYNPAGRSRRNSDWFFESWQGLLSGDDGEPLAFIVNPQPFKESHFATFPPKLVEPMVKASTSERGQCPHCGSPWARTHTPATEYGSYHDHVGDLARGQRHEKGRKLVGSDFYAKYERRTTTGWQPTCRCEPAEPVPQTILDPFCGSGTVGLVADRLGRDSILIDLKPDYSAMAQQRITQDAPLFVQLDTD